MNGAIFRFFFGAILLLCWLGLAELTEGASKATFDIEAYSGKPFGVARITVSDDEARHYWWQLGGQLSLENLAKVQSADQTRPALYQAFQVKTPITEISDRYSRRWTVYFLFQGDQDFKVGIFHGLLTHSGSRKLAITPVDDPKGHARLLGQWWDAYCDDAQQVNRTGLYRPSVENYLVNMLSRRLKLKPPRLLYNELIPSGGDVGSIISVMSGAESIRLAIQSETMLKTSDGERITADQPLPKAVAPPPVEIPEIKETPAIEPIASHVPVECLYVRFGTFENFLWSRDFIEKHGGPIRVLMTHRGIDYGITKKLEQQLGLSLNPLSRMLGEKAISDVALIGTDTFIREGASIGMIFEAKNDAVLGEMLTRQRQLIKMGTKSVKHETLTIAGREVSLLHTADNRVRSFYVADGKYHLVTTSRYLVRRFIEAGQGTKSLADAPEFRWGRTKVPLSKKHTITAYLSDAFFRQIVSPKYRIEMTRRSQAVAELELVQMAILAAAAEGTPTRDLRRLIELGLLPPHFGKRPDGSHVIIEKDRVVDSLRGVYGSFTPVVDLPIDKATPAEVQGYKAFAVAYNRLWRKMDPVTIGLRREVDTKKKTQRLAADIFITPYVRSHFGWFADESFPSDKQTFQAIEGSPFAVELNYQKTKYTLGLQDFPWPVIIRNGKLLGLDQHFTLHGMKLFLGAISAHKKGLAGSDAASILQEVKIDKEGYFQWNPMPDNIPNIWGRLTEKQILMTTEEKAVDTLLNQLKLVPSENKAKIRFRYSDPKEMPHTYRMLRMGHYVHSRRISAGNITMLHKIMQQLDIPAEKTLATAELILHGKPACPLGGKYQRKTIDNRYSRVEFDKGQVQHDSFTSSAFTYRSGTLARVNRVPSSYKCPLLESFRNALVEIDVDPDTLTIHFDLEIADH